MSAMAEDDDTFSDPPSPRNSLGLYPADEAAPNPPPTNRPPATTGSSSSGAAVGAAVEETLELPKKGHPSRLIRAKKANSSKRLLLRSVSG